MATIKSFTDLNQSKVLSKILPLESADMSWQQIYNENHMMSDYRVELIPYRLYSGIGVSCWSLAALLGVLPRPSLHQTKDKWWYCNAEPNRLYFSEHHNNPIDACVDMIEKLHELKML